MYDLLVVAFWALVGLVWGSFANVVISRVPEGRSVVRPGSRCPECLGPIGAKDNIPVVSYLLLRGRCRHCGHPIGWRYPATEIAMGAAFALVAARVWVAAQRPGASLVAMWATVIFVCVALIDTETKRIPRPLVYWGMACAVPLTVGVALYERRLGAIAVSLIAAVCFRATLFAIHALNPKWMGFGDVRYAFFLGWVLGYFGWWYPLAALMLALVTGSLVGLFLVAIGKSRFGKAIPFGPFLSLGSYAAIVWGPSLASFYLELIGRSIGLPT